MRVAHSLILQLCGSHVDQSNHDPRSQAGLAIDIGRDNALVAVMLLVLLSWLLLLRLLLLLLQPEWQTSLASHI